VTSASCSLKAPSANGSYNADFLANDGYTVLASAPFTVTGGGGGGSVAVVQTLTDHGVSSAHANGTQKCVWQFSQPIGTGDTVVGYVHSANNVDTHDMYPQSVTDNAGHTYNLSPGVLWVPFPEDIGIWYLTNIQGNPNTFTFDYTQYPASGNTVLDFCDVGFAEYSGANSITVVNPALVTGATPSLTISPPNPSRIWAFASPYLGGANSMLNSGYSLIINDFGDDIGVWGSDSLVPAGSLTLKWNAPAGAPGTCVDGSFSYPPGCPTVVSAVAVQGSGQ
jgi:hypothetical protein